MQVTAVLNHAQEGGYVAYNPETGSTTQGETIDEALANLREAVELYLDEEPMSSNTTPCVTRAAVREHAENGLG